MPEDLYQWRDSVRALLDPATHQELFGGYNNLVTKTDTGLTIFWRQSTTRWVEIMRAALLEHHISATFGIRGRELQSPDSPITITPEGLLATHTSYIADAEGRYPWNDEEIAAASMELGKLHTALRHVTFDSHMQTPAAKDGQLLHRDFGRGNILFERNSSRIAGVIDYERVGEGPIEQDLGKTLSLLLVDTKIPEGDWHRNPTSADFELLTDYFAHRLAVWIGNYPDKVDVVDVSLWAELYLRSDDYGDLNHVRDMAMSWLNNTILSEQNPMSAPGQSAPSPEV
jgi:hypothetical protein